MILSWILRLRGGKRQPERGFQESGYRKAGCPTLAAFLFLRQGGTEMRMPLLTPAS